MKKRIMINQWWWWRYGRGTGTERGTASVFARAQEINCSSLPPMKNKRP
jgi:hypothetical protein